MNGTDLSILAGTFGFIATGGGQLGQPLSNDVPTPSPVAPPATAVEVTDLNGAVNGTDLSIPNGANGLLVQSPLSPSPTAEPDLFGHLTWLSETADVSGEDDDPLVGLVDILTAADPAA